jgi:hypothetical protein
MRSQETAVGYPIVILSTVKKKPKQICNMIFASITGILLLCTAWTTAMRIAKTRIEFAPCVSCAESGSIEMLSQGTPIGGKHRP